MSERYVRKKRNLFLNKSFQGRFALVLFITIICSAAIFALLLGFFSADSMTIRYTDSDIQVGATPFMLFKSAVMANWVFLVLVGGGLILSGIAITHRVAGPLYHFEKVLLQMSDGDLSHHVYLRRKDEGKKLAVAINRCSGALSDRLRTIRSQAEEAAAALAEAEQCNDQARCRQLLGIAKQHNEALRETVALFTLGGESGDN